MSSRFQRAGPSIVAQRGYRVTLNYLCSMWVRKGSKGRWTTIPMLFMPADDVIA